MTRPELLEHSGSRPSGGPQSSAEWIRYFKENARMLLPIPWEGGPILTAAERAALLPSLLEFQQGEGLEGGHFFRCVRVHGERTGDLDYVEAHRLFMAEEQRHARDLGRFLRSAGVTPLTGQALRNWLFRWCGSRGGLELTLTIVVVVEMVAQVYYRAVHDSTLCPVLRRLCAQILRDELNHVRFHCERLALMRSGRLQWRLALTHALDGFLFTGAVLGCWWGHAPALRAGGFGLRRFWREASTRFPRASKLKRPLPQCSTRLPESSPCPTL